MSSKETRLLVLVSGRSLDGDDDGRIQGHSFTSIRL